MLHYPARFDPQPEGGYTVTFRDIPEAITQGDTLDDAREMAADVLLSSMDFYAEDRREVPAPSTAREGEELVVLPMSAAAKVLLLNEMVRQRVKPAELARRLGTSPQVVTRLVDLHHTTKIDAIDDALRALGRGLQIAVV